MPPIAMPTPEQTLEAAAAYIREKGWVQGEMGGGGAPACLMGALREATRELIPMPDLGPRGDAAKARRENLSNKARRLLEARIKACFPRTAGAREESVVLFNDAKGRKVEQVLQVLEGGCE